MIEGLLVGSRALEFYYGSKFWRTPNDWDVWTVGNEYKTEFIRTSSGVFEVKTFPRNSLQAKLITNFGYKAGHLKIEQFNLAVASPVVCLMIKLSHIDFVFKPKHLEDILYLSRRTMVNQYNQEIIKNLREDTKRRMQTKEEFFSDKVFRIIPHDDLHKYVAQAIRNNEIAYLDSLTNEVDVDETLFKSLSLEKQKNIIIDEAIVLTLERFVIPSILNNKKIVDVWEYSTSTGKPFEKWLNKLASDYAIKKHPVWLSQWIRQNYSTLELQLKEDIVKIKYKLPRQFWNLVINNGVNKNV